MLTPVQQAGVVAIADGKVCLVTSRSGRRWVVPKGVIDPGHTAGEAALVEAWEEAGLVGTLHPDPLGTYRYEKYDREHLVLVYRMTVTEVRDTWPEQGLREREWVTIAEAVGRVEEAGLREIIRLLEPTAS